MATEICLGILKWNIRYSSTLAQLELEKDKWFVDAVTSWGIGGCAGGYYFMLGNEKLYGAFGGKCIAFRPRTVPFIFLIL